MLIFCRNYFGSSFRAKPTTSNYIVVIAKYCHFRFEAALKEAAAVDELISKLVNESDGAIERYKY